LCDWLWHIFSAYNPDGNLAALKNETALANVSGVVAELAVFAAGAPEARMLPGNMHGQTKAIILSVFIS
jgi:hypothetical protein